MREAETEGGLLMIVAVPSLRSVRPALFVSAAVLPPKFPRCVSMRRHSAETEPALHCRALRDKRWRTAI